MNQNVNENSNPVNEIPENFKTDNFEVNFTESEEKSDVEMNIFYKGKKLMSLTDNTFHLSVRNAYDIPLSELSQIPALIEMNEDLDVPNYYDEGGHSKTILDYTTDGALLGIVVFEPKDEFFYQNLDREKYSRSLIEVIKSDSRLKLEPDSEEEVHLDIDSLLALQNTELPVDYSPLGPIAFTVELKAQTFGELSLAACQLMHELEEKVKLYF